MDDLTALKQKTYDYVDRMAQDEIEFSSLLYRIYKITGRKGLFGLIQDYLAETGSEFPYSINGAYRLAKIEENVNIHLPWDEYPHVGRQLRRRIHESTDTEHYIHLLQEGEDPATVAIMLKKSQNKKRTVLCTKCKKEIPLLDKLNPKG